jgi:hypothetical protein
VTFLIESHHLVLVLVHFGHVSNVSDLVDVPYHIAIVIHVIKLGLGDENVPWLDVSVPLVALSQDYECREDAVNHKQQFLFREVLSGGCSLLDEDVEAFQRIFE